MVSVHSVQYLIVMIIRASHLITDLRTHSLQGHSVLVFCATKANTENVAKLIARLVAVPERAAPGGQMAATTAITREALVAEFRRLPGGADSVLAEVAARGVAFHHSGLTAEEKELIETGYKAGAISVLCATSTLAAGVNLPARRVIFRHPYIGMPNNMLDATR